MFYGNKIKYEDVILAGLEALSRRANSDLSRREMSSENSLNNYTGLPAAYIPSPAKNHIPMVRISLVAACLANAAHIGIE